MDNATVKYPAICIRLTEQAQADIVVVRDWLVAQTRGGARISQTDCICAALRLAVERIEDEERQKRELERLSWPAGTIRQSARGSITGPDSPASAQLVDQRGHTDRPVPNEPGSV